MTLSEFKAWFEGFTEGVEAAPTEAQFAKIKAKVAKIDGALTTYPVFIDRLWHHDYDRYRDYSRPYWSGGISADASSGVIHSKMDGVSMQNSSYAYIDPTSKGDNQTVTFDSHAAMRDLGRAEAVN